jgi:tetratricopeptide (TPR) repeat protein
LAEKEIAIALNYEKDDSQTSSIIATYYSQVLDFPKAEQHLLKAIKISNDGEDYIALARIYVSQNKFEEAKKVIEEANKQGADPVDVYLAKAAIAEAQTDLDAADAMLADALKRYPGESDLLSENSYVLFQKGQIAQSAQEAERAVALNPYNAAAHIEKAFAYEAQGKFDEALAAAKQGVQLYPKYDRAHYILGLCYMDLGMKEDAVAEFETFLKLYWERPLVKEYKEKALMYLEQLK